MDKKKKIIAISAIASILIILVSLLSINMGILKVNYVADTETNTVVYDPTGVGYYTVKGGWDVDKTGNTYEMLDDTKYISSWLNDGESEKIAIKASYDHSQPSWVKFNIYLDPNGNWDNPMYKSTPEHPYSPVIIWTDTSDGNNIGTINEPPAPTGGPITMSHIIQLKGKISGMYLRVEFQVRASGITYGRTLTIHDEAVILDGSGNINIRPSQDGDDVFDTGERVTFSVTTGASGASIGEPNKGWQLSLHDPNGQSYIGNVILPDGSSAQLPLTLPDNLEGYDISWIVPDSAYRPDWNNKWTAVLKNLLIEQDKKFVYTVDTSDKMPSMVSMEISDTTPTPPQTVTVTLTGKPNDNTQLPISKFMVDAYYGTPNNPQSYIIQSGVFNAVNDKATFSMNINAVGDITIVARCYDTENRPSSPLTQTIEASGRGDNDGGYNNGIDYEALAIISAIIAIPMLLLYLTGRKRKGNIGSQNNKNSGR